MDYMCSTFQGAIGGKALLETVRSHPKQAEALRKSNGKAGWISARDVRAFYSTQDGGLSAVQYREAPALSKSRRSRAACTSRCLSRSFSAVVLSSTHDALLARCSGS